MRAEELKAGLDLWLAGWGSGDAAHDAGHIRRVAANSLKLARAEGADETVVLCAAYLHDLVLVPKDSPDRSKASLMSAEASLPILAGLGLEPSEIERVRHAIEAHSFSAGIEPETVEAAVVQDADRLDALGAVGIARCLMLSGQMGRALMDDVDPLAREREPDDRKFTLDHFPMKLFRIAGTMKPSGSLNLRKSRLRWLN